VLEECAPSERILTAELKFDDWDSAPKGTETPKPEVSVDALFDLVRRAAPFGGLSRAAFEGVLDLLSGRYPSDEFAELRPRLTWDRIRNVVTARDGAAPGDSQCRHHSRPRPLWRFSGLQRRQGRARGRARRGDGLRIASRRDLHPRRVHLAHCGDHPRPRSGDARSRRAGQNAVLEGRWSGPAARVRPPHRRAGARTARTAQARCADAPGWPSTISIPARRRI
jgi:hypothetical protein